MVLKTVFHGRRFPFASVWSLKGSFTTSQAITTPGYLFL
jgi:hypothetical protein